MASDNDLRYHYLGGDIGLVTNSAGGCMAICDLIEQLGAKPANFSDLGGQAIHEQIEALLYLLQNDPNVKVIFINVFGGILNVDKVIATLKIQIRLGIMSKPIVIRARGLKSDGAEEILKEDYEGGIYFEREMDEAVKLAIKLSKEVQAKETNTVGADN